MSILEKINDYLEEQELKKKYMNDPLYAKVLKAKNKKEYDKAIETLKSIRGETAYQNFVKASKTLSETKTWVDAAKKVIKDRQYVYINPKNNEISDEKKSGYIMLDTTTSNMLTSIYDALSGSAQKKFANMNITQAVDIGWKLIK